MRLRGAVNALLDHQCSEVLCEGRAGTGKTTGILRRIVDFVSRYPSSRHLICRATRTSLTQSVLVTLERSVLGETHPLVINGPGRANRESYIFPNRSEIVCGGLDHPERLFSTEWDTVYVAEATEIDESAWELFGRAMRNGRMPFVQRVADCNPTYPSHWLNKRADAAGDELRRITSAGDYATLQMFNAVPCAGRMKRLISVHEDNPGYFDAKTWSWTEAGKRFIHELQSMSGSRRSRMLDGLWVAAEGSIFPEFDARKHVVQPFVAWYEEAWPTWTAYDPGADHPTAILWVTRAPNGCLYVVDEIYRGGLPVAEHCREMLRREGNYPCLPNIFGRYADPQYAFSSTASSIETIAQQAEKCGVVMSPWPRTGDTANELQMIEAVRGMLVSGRLKVFATCQNTINEFQSWMWKRKRDGSIKDGQDQPEDRNNDAMDCLKGLVAARIQDGPTKVEVLVAKGSKAEETVKVQAYRRDNRERQKSERLAASTV
jgi:PBSX family phage terminase large subunit